MILLDTNVVVFLHEDTLSEADFNKLKEASLHTCNVIIAETIGWTSIDPKEEKYYGDLLKSMSNHEFNDEVTDKVIEIRKTTNIKLPDAIIAATALVNNLELWTRNTRDFKKVRGLKLYSPAKKINL